MSWTVIDTTPGQAPVLLTTEAEEILTTEAGLLISTGANGDLWDDIAVTPEVWTPVTS